MEPPDSASLDINKPNFNPELYIQTVFKRCSLREVMEREASIIKDTQTLHSDMQTLVYENYNKFISASDTIKKMTNDFKEMESEMDLLAANMNSIASFSDQISTTLHDTRQKLTQLSSVHTTLQKVQFLFRLPHTLKKNLEDGSLTEAVQNYSRALGTLKMYHQNPSFSSIHKECDEIMLSVKEQLFGQLSSKQATPKELAECVELLLSLGEPAPVLCVKFLEHASERQSEQLQSMEDHLRLRDQDVIEFLDIGSNDFLSDLCLNVATYNELFAKKCQIEEGEDPNVLLANFIQDAMDKYLDLVKRKVEDEQSPGTEATVLVRALDRFYRRLQAACTLLPGPNYAKYGMEVVVQAGGRQSQMHLKNMQAHFKELLSNVRQTLAAPKLSLTLEEEKKNLSSSNLPELLNTLVAGSVEKIKISLQDLKLFLQSDLTFSLKQLFRAKFCSSVREDFLVAFIKFLMETASGFCVPQTPPTLLLLLSKMCLEMESSTVNYLLSQTDEEFCIEDAAKLTTKSSLCKQLHDSAQKLLDYFVRTQGLSLSQMLRKSVETRDWLSTPEPRTVRAVMKRVVEDVAAIEILVGSLYEQGIQQERSSDSSRRTQRKRTNWYAPSQIDSKLASNLQKLFSERIEIFSSVELSTVSIMTGIIKISLKTLLECVRLRTFSKFGLQQIQVDTHYLQMYLWRFVENENLVHFLLDEILGSTVHRCLDPVLMEPSVVEMICERG
ncbi:vacuolar protein sorting-associated protein 51 homolog [Neocloeon triangulifer]|uniref:vacuolar protein sorting-associated protein 51 homolog n=1 Tax=Neocloeon triangulifer TaxID=2078957 RepID=UPI00286FAD62|nr:vacuolar protein sorting-associated protein 51 homolog [Neocloeon triangulifer]